MEEVEITPTIKGKIVRSGNSISITLSKDELRIFNLDLGDEVELQPVRVEKSIKVRSSPHRDSSEDAQAKDDLYRTLTPDLQRTFVTDAIREPNNALAI